MSGTEVTNLQTSKNASISQPNSKKNGSCSGEKEKSKEVVQKESDKNIASAQLEVGVKKNGIEEGLKVTQSAELIAKLASMEISKDSSVDLKGHAENKKTETGQAADSNNASNSLENINKTSFFDTMMRINADVPSTRDAVGKLCSKFEEFCHQEKDYKSYFDAMYAKVLEDTENNVPRDDAKSIFPASGHVDNIVETISEANISDNQTEECEFLSQVGPGDLVSILHSLLFCETGSVNPKETTNGDNAGLTYTIDEVKDQQNKSLATDIHMASEEQETEEDRSIERKTRVLEMKSVDFKADKIDIENI